MTIRARASTFALAIVLFFAGCHGGGPAAAWDACSLLTADDAATLIGPNPQIKPQKDIGKKGERPYVTQCLYHTPQGALPYQSVSILVRLAQEGAKAEGARERHAVDLKSAMGESYVLEPFDGLGNGALWDPRTNQLSVFRGADLFLFSAMLENSGETRALLTKLAPTVLARAAE